MRTISQSPFMGLVAIALCAGLLASGYMMGRLPRWVLWLYTGTSIIAFIAYATDKAAAMRGARRIPEQTLHMLALAGGWPGAWLAQQWLRHKTVKPSFRAVFVGTVILNIVGIVWLASTR